MNVDELEKQMRDSFSNLREDMLFFKNNINELKTNIKNVQEEISKMKQDLDYVKALRQEDMGRPRAKLLEEQEFVDVDEEEVVLQGEDMPPEQYAEDVQYDDGVGEVAGVQPDQYDSVMDDEDLPPEPPARAVSRAIPKQMPISRQQPQARRPIPQSVQPQLRRPMQSQQPQQR